MRSERDLIAKDEAATDTPWVLLDSAQPGIADAKSTWQSQLPAGCATNPRILVADLTETDWTQDESVTCYQHLGETGVMLLLCSNASFANECAVLSKIFSAADADALFVRRVSWAGAGGGWCTVIARKSAALTERIADSSALKAGGILMDVPPQRIEYDSSRHILWNRRTTEFWERFFQQMNLASVLVPGAEQACALFLEPKMSSPDLAEYVSGKQLSFLRGCKANDRVKHSAMRSYCGSLPPKSAKEAGNKDDARWRGRVKSAESYFQTLADNFANLAVEAGRSLKRHKSNTDDIISRCVQRTRTDVKLPEVLRKAIGENGPPLGGLPLRLTGDGFVDLAACQGLVRQTGEANPAGSGGPALNQIDARMPAEILFAKAPA